MPSLNSYYYRCPPELGIDAQARAFKILNYCSVAPYWLIGFSSLDSRGELLYRERELLTYCLDAPLVLFSETEATDNPWADKHQSIPDIPFATARQLQSLPRQSVRY